MANLNGVFIYDGKYWQQAPLPNSGSAYSLLKSSAGTIYVGGTGEFGYLSINQKGEIYYTSLIHLLKKEDQNSFQEVWTIIETKNKIYFCSNNKLFCYNNKEIKSYLPVGEKFHTFFNINNHLYVKEQGIGFKVMINENLEMVDSSSIFQNIKVYAILQLSDKEFIVATRKGLYKLYHNEKYPTKSIFKKLKNENDEWFIESEVTCGTKLNSNSFAFGSSKNGILILSETQKLKSLVNTNVGLMDDNVKAIYSDINNNLWLSLNSGIAMCEVNSPISKWTKQDGINGVVESSAKYEGTIYIATDKGVFKNNKLTNKFEPTKITEQAWDLKVYNNKLFASTITGFYSINNNDETNLLYQGEIFTIFVDEANRLFYLGGENTLVSYTYTNTKFNISKHYDVTGNIRSIAKNKEGFIVIGNEADGIYVIDAELKITQLKKENGLPSNNENFVFNVNNKIVIGTDSGFYEWSHKNPNTVCYSAEYNKLIRKSSITKSTFINNSIWFTENGIDTDPNSNTRINKISLKKGKYYENTSYLKRINGIGARHFFNDSNQIFISTNQGLFCADESKPELRSTFYAILYKLHFGNDADTNYRLQNFSETKYNYPTELIYRYNQLHILPTATNFYGDNSKIEFSYYLLGREEDYGNWVKNEHIDYSDLKEGYYTFYLKAKDNLGNISDPISLSFIILPPWYRTIWSYLAYTGFVVCSIILLIHLNTKRLKEANIKLENNIKERTKTILEQKQELQHKNTEITDSINYAKRIQFSILPSVSEIKEVWKNLFIFYQPKDIVSGDFYWFKKINDYEFLIASADCTGHGVPGGFMSMICSGALKDASRISHKPGEILFHANNSVKDSLSQGQIIGGSKDGMEIALLHLNIQTKTIIYAGANRFLWVLKKDAMDIEDIKPTKGSIASTTEYNFTYQEHKFNLSPGDQLYMSTDGFPDQFGGSGNKKYMTKNFKKLIMSISKKDVIEQELILKNTINTWMRDTEQVDDLLVIGIRL